LRYKKLVEALASIFDVDADSDDLRCFDHFSREGHDLPSCRLSLVRL
jgi:hypothetical protein